MIRIAAVLVDRANYGRMKPVLKILDEDKDVDLKIIATGTMLLDRFGMAVEVVKRDGFNVSDEIYIELEGSVPSTMAKSIGLSIIELSNVYQRLNPEFVLIIGDRSEALGAAIAAVYQNFCLIHIQGGEITGSIDESARHAITKLAHYHFPSTYKSYKNILQMGEKKSSVFFSGCPSADVVRIARKSMKIPDLNGGVGTNIDFNQDFLLVLYHPVTTEYFSAEKSMIELLEALKKVNMQTILIWPNIDAGSDGVSQAIRRFREFNPDLKLRAFKNFEPEDFIPLLDNAKCLVGNSSSFIRDASFLGTPVVLVGSRQDGRERAPAVTQVVEDRFLIANAIEHQMRHGKYPESELYGKPGVSDKIASIIKNLEKVQQKKFVVSK